MTRINVVPVKELCNQHLFAEWRELPRIFTLMNKRGGQFTTMEIPSKYQLGPGHIKFFFNKLLFLDLRHRGLTVELLKRGYDISKDYKDLEINFPIEQLCKCWNDYEPTEEALTINRNRIKQRMPKHPRWS